MRPTLKEFIKLIVLEEGRIKEADITGDERVPWGSNAHIADLEKRISDLAPWRDKQRRGSEARANYARVISRLKAELDAARKENLKLKTR